MKSITIRSQSNTLKLFVAAWLCCVATLAMAQPTRTNYFIGGASNERWHQTLNWVTDPLGLGAPIGDGSEAIVFYQSNKFAGARFNLKTQYPTESRTNFYSIVFTNGPFDAYMFGNNPPIRVGAGSITIQEQVTNNILYRMPTYFDAPRTIANYSTNATMMTCEADNGGYTTEPAKYWIFNVGANTLTLDGPGSFTFSRGSGAIQGTSAGLIKNGSGAASLQGTNTFTGTIALNAGSLTIGSVHAGNNAVTVADLTTFGATVSEANKILALSSLTLGNNTAGNVTNVFNLGAFGNPTPGVPVVNATALAANGTNWINVTGLGLSIGQITLLKCTGSIGGGARTFALGTLPAGREGQLIVNTDSVVLDITNAPVLLFTGVANSVTTGAWDINGTSNWVDQASGVPSYFLNGTSVQFDDTAATKTVLLNTNVQPFNLRVTNTLTYTFSSNNPSASIGGTARLIKEGSGTLILGTSNTFSGYTYIANGVLRLAAAEAIGNASDVTNNAVLQLGGFDEDVGVLNGNGTISNISAPATTNRLTIGGTGNGEFSGSISDGAGPLALTKDGGGIQKLSGNNTYSGGTRIGGGTLVLGGNNVLGTGLLEWTGAGSVSADATPRTVANQILISNARPNFGSSGAARTTFSGSIDLGGLDRRLQVNSDVLFSGASIGNGMIQSKENAGTLTLRNISGDLALTTVNMAVQDGALVLDGAQITNSVSAVYIQSTVAGGTAWLVLSNNATLAMTAGTGNNLRIGSVNTSGSSSTNIVEVDGSALLLTNGAAINLGRVCRNPVLRVKNGGVVQALAINHYDDPNAPVSEVFLDNATLRPTEDRAAYMEGLSNVVVNAGGLTVDTLAFTIGFAQDVSGAGGLTKIGSGRLNLNGNNTYAGTTTVSEGSLGGSGTISGPVVVSSGAALVPGGNDIGTLTINNSLNLNAASTTLMQVDNIGVPVCDALVVSGSITAVGALQVSLVGTSPLSVGDTFQLFNKAVSGFSSVTLPAGYTWNNNLAVNGSISVAAVSGPPLVWDTTSNPGNLTFTWTGSYKLQAQTNSITGTWSDYQPAGDTPPVIVPIDSTLGSVFFRLSSL